MRSRLLGSVAAYGRASSTAASGGGASASHRSAARRRQHRESASLTRHRPVDPRRAGRGARLPRPCLPCARQVVSPTPRLSKTSSSPDETEPRGLRRGSTAVEGADRRRSRDHPLSRSADRGSARSHCGGDGRPEQIRALQERAPGPEVTGREAGWQPSASLAFTKSHDRLLRQRLPLRREEGGIMSIDHGKERGGLQRRMSTEGVEVGSGNELRRT